MHVTMKLRRGLPPLRSRLAVRILWQCFARGRDRFGFRLVEFSIQRDHLHLIAEAPDCRSLARGMQGLAVRVAKNLNKGWGRRGTVFADRYHDRVLRTPREVRAALCYVLNNARHHRHWQHASAPDPLSSSWWFDGFRALPPSPAPPGPLPRIAARTWLLRVGWRRHGLIDPTAVPGPVPVAPSAPVAGAYPARRAPIAQLDRAPVF